eukprot:m.134039 g.134039  ORF g.134039 m.134039 type:complete len:244 (-) comp16905_c0_seq2:1070-1801(-)
MPTTPPEPANENVTIIENITIFNITGTSNSVASTNDKVVIGLGVAGGVTLVALVALLITQRHKLCKPRTVPVPPAEQRAMFKLKILSMLLFLWALSQTMFAVYGAYDDLNSYLEGDDDPDTLYQPSSLDQTKTWVKFQVDGTDRLLVQEGDWVQPPGSGIASSTAGFVFTGDLASTDDNAKTITISGRWSAGVSPSWAPTDGQTYKESNDIGDACSLYSSHIDHHGHQTLLPPHETLGNDPSD